MKLLDKYLQNVRIRKAAKFIKSGNTVLDIGSDDGILFRKLRKIKYGIGIEPKLDKNIEGENFKIIKGYFPGASLPVLKFDSITLLAVLEHIPVTEQEKLASSCYEVLNEGGNIIITVPSARVDYILAILKKLYLIDGMSLEQHYGFKITDTEKVFSSTFFKLITHQKFQFGLNNIFVFQKIN